MESAAARRVLEVRVLLEPAMGSKTMIGVTKAAIVSLPQSSLEQRTRRATIREAIYIR